MAQALRDSAGDAARAADQLQVNYRVFMQKARDYRLA